MNDMGEFTSKNDEWAGRVFGNQATPTESYYIQCAQLPSRLLFGPQDGSQFIIQFGR